MKPNYNNIIIVTLLLIVGGLTGGWITYAVMKNKQPDITKIETQSHETTDRINATDNNDSLRAITNQVAK